MFSFIPLITPAKNTSLCTYCMYICFDLSVHSCIHKEHPFFFYFSSPSKLNSHSTYLTIQPQLSGHSENILINLHIQTKLMYM